MNNMKYNEAVFFIANTDFKSRFLENIHVLLGRSPIDLAMIRKTSNLLEK